MTGAGYAAATCMKLDATTMAERPDNVIDLVPYRMARRMARKPPRPYLMWYPHLGFVPSSRATSVPTLLQPRRATFVGKHT